MKQLYFIMIIMLAWLPAQCQYVPLYYSSGQSNIYDAGGYLADSIFYMAYNGGGFYILNTNTGQGQIRFHNFYYTSGLCADTGNNVTFVKNDNQLFVYHYNADTAYNISPALQPGSYIHQVGRSATQTWMMADTNIIGRYNGMQWSYDTASFNTGYLLLVKDDSTAYVLNNQQQVVRFSNHAFTIKATLPQYTEVLAWDYDKQGNIWLATGPNIIRMDSAGNLVFFSDTALPFHATHAYLSNVLCDDSGNVYCLSDKIYKFNGQSWQTDSALYGTPFGINRHTGKIYGQYGSNQLFTLLNNNASFYPVNTDILHPVKAAGLNLLATPAGIFSVQTFGGMQIDKYIDTVPYYNDVTCFEKTLNPGFDYGNNDTLYGTHHGVFSLNGAPFYNNLLPDSNINFISQLDNITYIGTNKGLGIIANGSATYYDTTNSPIPSNKITAVGIYYAQRYPNPNDTILCIGTDRGFATKDSAGWQIYDTARLQVPNCYVSDIAAGNQFYYYGDSAFEIATLGQGLIELSEHGNFAILNTSNNGFPDDSVFYINSNSSFYTECGQATYYGTASHGMVNSSYSGTFYADTNISGMIIHRSDMGSDVWSTGDSGFILYQICGGITQVNKKTEQLRWHQDGSQLNIFLPESYSGRAQLTLYNLQGQVVSNTETNAVPGNVVNIPAAKLAGGLYVLQCNLQGTMLYTKLVYSR